MFRKIFLILFIGLLLDCIAVGQTHPQKSSAPDTQTAFDLAGSLAQRLSNDLHVKTVIGEPIKVGSVSLIPILMIEVSFGGGAMTSPPSPASAQQGPAAAADAFLMSGEARPMGFIAITQQETRFISVAKQANK